MKTKIYEVPAELMPDFARVIEEHELTCGIIAVSEEDEIVVEVDYEEDEKEAIHELSDLIDDYLDELEDEENEDEDDE